MGMMLTLGLLAIMLLLRFSMRPMSRNPLFSSNSCGYRLPMVLVNCMSFVYIIPSFTSCKHFFLLFSSHGVISKFVFFYSSFLRFFSSIMMTSMNASIRLVHWWVRCILRCCCILLFGICRLCLASCPFHR